MCHSNRAPSDSGATGFVSVGGGAGLALTGPVAPGAIMARLLLCCLTGLVANDRTSASDPEHALCTLRDGPSFTATLSDVTDTGDAVFAEASGPRTVAMDDLVTWGAYADRSQATHVVLVDGSVLVADIQSIEADSRGRCRSTLAGNASAPRGVRAIVFHPPADPRHATSSSSARWPRIARDERLLLENGDELAGHCRKSYDPTPVRFC